MSEPQVTLASIRKELKKPSNARAKVFTASDLIDGKLLAEMRERARKNAKKRQAERLFDDIDAMGAEIIARFGWEVYDKWNHFEIPFDTMTRWLHAERAREKENILGLETIIAAVVSSCIKRGKKEPAPKGPKVAQKIIDRHAKIARGEK